MASPEPLGGARAVALRTSSVHGFLSHRRPVADSCRVGGAKFCMLTLVLTGCDAGRIHQQSFDRTTTTFMMDAQLDAVENSTDRLTVTTRLARTEQVTIHRR